MHVIGITGGSGSGKSTLSEKIIEQLGNSASVLPMDSYYHNRSYLPLEERQKLNFDQPEAIDLNLYTQHISLLLSGQKVHAPVYDYITSTRLIQTVLVEPAPLLILEGLYILTSDVIRSFVHQIFYLDLPEDLRLKRIMKRDINCRGKNENGVTSNFYTNVAPMHNIHIEPYKNLAHQVVSMQETEKALQTILQYVRTYRFK